MKTTLVIMVCLLVPLILLNLFVSWVCWLFSLQPSVDFIVIVNGLFMLTSGFWAGFVIDNKLN